jgi:hypothetical protein
MNMTPKGKEKRYSDDVDVVLMDCAEHVYIERLKDAGGDPAKLKDGEARKRAVAYLPIVKHTYDYLMLRETQ